MYDGVNIVGGVNDGIVGGGANDSFQHVSNWLSNARSSAHKNATIFLVGNKKDLKDEELAKIYAFS